MMKNKKYFITAPHPEEHSLMLKRLGTNNSQSPDAARKPFGVKSGEESSNPRNLSCWLENWASSP